MHVTWLCPWVSPHGDYCISVSREGIFMRCQLGPRARSVAESPQDGWDAPCRQGLLASALPRPHTHTPAALHLSPLPWGPELLELRRPADTGPPSHPALPVHSLLHKGIFLSYSSLVLNFLFLPPKFSLPWAKAALPRWSLPPLPFSADPASGDSPRPPPTFSAPGVSAPLYPPCCLQPPGSSWPHTPLFQ